MFTYNTLLTFAAVPRWNGFLFIIKYRNIMQRTDQNPGGIIVLTEDSMPQLARCVADILREEFRVSSPSMKSSIPAGGADELGCEPACKIFGTDYEPMCEILCRRYERRQVMVITTNLGDDLLCRTYGRRLWDRLNESYDMITFEGINFRTI